MLKIIESLKKGNEHIVVNDKMIEIFKNIFNEEIEIFIDETQWNELKYSHNKEIKYKKINVIGHGKSKLKSVMHFLKSMYQNIKFIILSRKDDKLLYLSVNPIGLFIMKIINKILNREVYMVCHSELEFLIAENDKYLSNIYKKIARVYRYSFNKIKNDNIKYIILGESIKKNLLKESKNINKKNLIVIDHPYEYKKLDNEDMDINKDVISIGCVGIGSIAKGTENIFKIAEFFKEEIENKKIKMSIIGKITDEVKVFANKYVEYLNDGDMLPRGEYEKKIKELDYILYFYPKDSYKLIASGAFFDAVSLEKPIIAIENDFFRYYFDKLGDIGDLGNNVDEMKEKIKDILKDDKKRYEIQIKNLKKAKESLSILNIVNQLMKQIKKN